MLIYLASDNLSSAICNEMIMDPEKYCDPILSMSTSTYLYKGKGKARDDPSSYRKVSIGSIINKIIDCYLADTVKTLIRNNQTDLQYGFTKGIDYKSCTVLRETATEYQKQEKKNLDLPLAILMPTF